MCDDIEMKLHPDSFVAILSLALLSMCGCQHGHVGGGPGLYAGYPFYAPAQPYRSPSSPHSVDIASPFLQGVAAGQGRYVPPGGGYVGTGGDYWIRKNIGSGSFIMLNDGSLWEVDSFDRLDATLWLAMESVVIVDNSNGFMPHRLVNTDTRESVGAKRVDR